jgi:plastocyanin
MFRRFFLTIFILLVAVAGLSAQTVIKTLKVSTKDFSNTPGTPRVVRNNVDHEWLVAWRQQGAPSKIFGRLVTSQGTLKPRKALATKVSAEAQSFDIAFDSVNDNYLLAFENAAGLHVQLFNNLLKKSGAAKRIESGVSGTIPRLSFDSVTGKFLLFWVGDSGTTLKSVQLNADGSTDGSSQVLSRAAGSSTYRSLNVSVNQDTRNLLALITESNGAAAKLLGFRIKPDGSLQVKKALPVSPSDPDLNAIFADSSFSDAGTGFAFWNDANTVKHRRLTRTGKLSGSIKSTPGEADGNSAQTSIVFDSKNNQFVPVWTFGNSVRSMALTSTGAVKQNPFVIETSDFTNALNATSSYDSQLGNAIAVWEDSTASASTIAGGGTAKFRIRAALFFFQGGGGGGSTHDVSIGDNFFSNGDLTISLGDTVRWTNNGNVGHTSTSGSESNAGAIWNSGTLSRGESFSFRFSNPGSFPYFCRIHGSLVMSGTITVQASATESPQP